MRSCFAALVVLSLAVSLSTADDKEDAAKHKTLIDERAKKLKLKPHVIVETPDLLVCAWLPEAKAKTLAEGAQKAVATARENLKYGKKDSVYSGKLAVYAFADHADMKAFIRTIEQRRPEQDAYTLALRGATPHVAVSPDPGSKLIEADLSENAAAWSAAAVLNKKVGGTGTIPEWLQLGYGKACTLRSDTPAKQTAYRTKVKTLVTGKSKAPVWAKDLWNGSKVPERDLIAASFVEYLAFGPIAEKFVGFVRTAKGTPDDDKPMIDAAITGLETNADNLDAAWKQWVVKGK